MPRHSGGAARAACWHRGCHGQRRDRRWQMHDATMFEVGWWSEVDEQAIACLRNGPQSTQDLAWKLGMSPTPGTPLLSIVAPQSKARITPAERARYFRQAERRL